MTTSFAPQPQTVPPLLAPTLPDFCAAEAKAINRRFSELRIAARCVRARSYDALGWTVYGIELGMWPDGRRERVDRVAAAVGDLNEALTALRRRRTLCRLERTPLQIEVPHPVAVPVPAHHLRHTDPHTAEVGQRRDGHGLQRMALQLDRHHHTLIAAATGYGKSVLLRQALVQLAANTSPADLRLVLVDLKNDDLPRLAGLPHIVTIAGTLDDARAAVAMVDAERRRRIASQDRPYRLILAIDEAAQLPDDSQDLLAGILATGRSMQINVLAATQMPTAAAIGKLAARLFTLRLVGRLDSARAAAVATGRPDTGAHELPWPGDFLWIDGADTLRWRAYAFDTTDVPTAVAAVRRQWSATQPAPVTDHVTTSPIVVDDTAARARAMVAQGMSRNAICQALWARPYAGGYKSKLDRLLASSTTTFPVVEAAPEAEIDASAVVVEEEDTERW